jgi:competence protein ComGC
MDNSSMPSDRMQECYHPDDIVRGLRASLIAVLATALSADTANCDYLKGVLSLARSQAALYDIPWSEFASSLRDLADLGLVETLQSNRQSCATDILAASWNER